MTRIAALLLVLLLTGCGPPKIESATPRSVALVYANGGAQDAAEQAERHCQQTGMHAQIGGTQQLTPVYARASYSCVP